MNGAGYANQMRMWVRKDELLDSRRTTGELVVSVPSSPEVVGMIFYDRYEDGGAGKVDKVHVSATLTPTRRLTTEEMRTTTPDEEIEGVQWRVSIDAGEGSSNYPMFFDDLFTAVSYLILIYD